jgi:hypothetical protein
MDAPASESNKAPKTAVLQVASVVGTGIGLAVGFYAGITLLIPLALIAVIAFGLTKLRPDRRGTNLPAAIVAGHAAWMVLGCILVRSWSQSLGEILVLGALALWIIVRPGLVPVAMLAVIESVEFCYALYMAAGESFGTAMHKARSVHAVLYLSATVLLLQAFIALRRARKSSPANGAAKPPPPAAEPAGSVSAAAGQTPEAGDCATD